jgi:hypothetical protein
MPTVVKVVTPPAADPVSLAEAKAQLRVTWGDDDAIISRLIKVARIVCETMGRVTAVNTVFDLTDDAFPPGAGPVSRASRQFNNQFSMNGGPAVFWAGAALASAGVITLPRAPVVSVASVTYLDASGASQVLSPSAYVVAPGAPGRLSPAFGQVWPNTYPVPAAVSVRFTAGYGPDASTAPEPFKQAILMYLTDLYENRGDALVGNAVAPSRVVAQLLDAQDNAGGYA